MDVGMQALPVENYNRGSVNLSASTACPILSDTNLEISNTDVFFE